MSFCQDPLVVVSYCSTTLAGMRPRPLTAMRAALSSPSLAGMLDERCELLAERGGVPLVQVDLVLRAAECEPHGLVGRATIKIVF
jgi:hypothetical protein